jgi:hypothetical protein
MPGIVVYLLTCCQLVRGREMGQSDRSELNTWRGNRTEGVGEYMGEGETYRTVSCSLLHVFTKRIQCTVM